MSHAPDPAIVRSPSGDEVDGRRLLAEAVGFGRALRRAGLSIDLGAAVDYARALTLVDLGQRETVRAAGAAVFVRRRDDREVYDRVFDRWWRRRGRRLPGEGPLPAAPHEEAPPGAEEADGGPADHDDAGAGDEGTVDGVPLPMSGGDESMDEADIDGHVAAPDAYSAAEALRHRDFDRMTAGRAARRRAAGRPPRAAPRAPPDAPLRAPPPRPPARAAGDAPAQPRDRRPVHRVGLAADGEAAAQDRRPVRHLRARWSAIRGCSCGSSRRSRRRPPSRPSRSCSGRSSPG